jgi:hypothetical protein
MMERTPLISGVSMKRVPKTRHRNADPVKVKKSSRVHKERASDAMRRDMYIISSKFN